MCYHLFEFLDIHLPTLRRAFSLILKNDRELYGADDVYEIKDTAPDELQQRVDDVVSGMVLVSG